MSIVAALAGMDSSLADELVWLRSEPQIGHVMEFESELMPQTSHLTNLL